MKRGLYILFLLASVVINAQTALFNSGNLRIHDQGQLGFHTDLINNGSFDENLGLAGFYGNNTLQVNGAFMPVLYDVEIANATGVNLNIPLSVTNNTNFVTGDFISPKDRLDIFYNFIGDAFTVGESDQSKINGYALITNKQSFAFPVGDEVHLRPLILNSEAVNDLARCAYFFEDPNNPSTFPPFDTRLKPRTIEAVGTTEFWRLEGMVPSTVSISWNPRSNMAGLVTEVNMVTLMGWNKTASRWLPLGTASVTGDLDNGVVSSNTFIPDDYEIITFGSLAEPADVLTLDNYLLTPNGDGINDLLVIPELEESPNNSLRIYDRNGLLVFEMQNYRDEFGGFSNVDNIVINRDQGLPGGVYFYLVSMDDLGLNFQGFLYLERTD
ncbi:MAG: gliding motility-associated C-terminal domain-containing protein [Flavobacteriaceae bacterium]